jgi:hypothetical protein
MQDQRPCEEFGSWQEFVDDPLTRLVMNADRVPAAQVERLCRGLEQRARTGRWQPLVMALPVSRASFSSLTSVESRE